MVNPNKKFSIFKKEIKKYFAQHGRKFPWRETRDPYHILVSEVMLQQTQTHRVVPKYEAFIKKFSTVEKLADAAPQEVLKMWQGLGYNRRAVALQKAATIICEKFDGAVPSETDVLDSLPGIGPATAASIAAFAFNKPTVFIETNIRAVFIHFFFGNKKRAIHDEEIMPIVAKTLDRKNPREWYFALMDYGVMLKKKHKNPSRKSAHHVKQVAFTGSNRQLRGLIVRTSLAAPALTPPEILRTVRQNFPAFVSKKTFAVVCERLAAEGLINSDGKIGGYNRGSGQVFTNDT